MTDAIPERIIPILREFAETPDQESLIDDLHADPEYFAFLADYLQLPELREWLKENSE